MNDELRALVAKWRAEADPASPGREWDGFGNGYASGCECCADELEAALTGPLAQDNSNLGELVIAMLIAAGYVTQAKCDEARKIALGFGPYALPVDGPLAQGWVMVPREATYQMLCEGDIAAGRGNGHLTAAIYAAMLAAAPPQTGVG